MSVKIRSIAHFIKSSFFTIVVHGVLIGGLFLSAWWPDSRNTAKRGSVKPIQAQVISSEEIQRQVEKQQQKIEQQKKRVEELKALEIRNQEEQEKLKALETQRKKQEKEQKQAERKKQQEIEEEKKRKAEIEKQKQQAEKKREEERKKAEAKKKQKAAAEKKQREAALKKQLETEQAAQTQTDAANALSALVDSIASAVENSWRRPLNSATGLKATIRVKLSRNGDVLSANVVKSSGDQFFDKSAELAVKKASPLPFPSNPIYYKYINEFDLLFKPGDY